MNSMQKDSEWSVIGEEPCKVIKFTPLAKIENGKVITFNKSESYTSVVFECKKLPEKTEGFILPRNGFPAFMGGFRRAKR